MDWINIGDAVQLEDGRKGLVTKNGIYEGQYWLEICTPSGVNLGAADYFFTDGVGPRIIQRLPHAEAVFIANLLSRATLKYGEGIWNDRCGTVKHLIEEVTP